MKHTVLALLAAAAAAPAQSTLTVGPGGFVDIGSAIAAANPGDIIEVAAGTYPAFGVDRGVTIRADGTGEVYIAPAQNPPDWMIPAGQTLHVIELTLRGVDLVGGRATFDNCGFHQLGGTALRIQNATAHIQDCLIFDAWTGSPAIDVQAGDLTMSGFFVLATAGMTGAPAIRLDASRLHASSGNIQHESNHCLRAQNGSVAWLSDTYLYTGNSSFSACALDVIGSDVRTDRLTFGGILPGGCATGAPGTLLGVQRTAPLTPGQPFQLDFHSAPNDILIIFAGPFLDTVDWSPFLEQPSWLDEQFSFSTTAMITDGFGEASASWTIPNSPAIANLTLWFKGVGGFAALPLQSSPVVGGVVR